ncbi:DegT/DnrJ/EryC1/StrS family aminotransferase [Alteribacter aurantiacus]|uniref:DegT/DnrJ/EryC1/StrS family aminotransferase n=1 Tax=Alteribacter aurantiacus TaxID=254410 RepID=UPI00041865E6|nr:DegT/DnrJ/EryC1/StrS family aminotransferase [Alteribacter aurantiacus]
MFIPLSKPDLTNLEKRYVREVMNSGQLSIGEKTKRFEALFKERFYAKYAVAMNSGTSALHVAVKALGLKDGDEVITTPYSFIASGNCLVYEKVKPVFVDIDPTTLNMDPYLIEGAITERTKAILVVHVFGQPCDMDQIMAIARKYDLRVIEDACEAIGAKWGSEYAGLIGDVGVYAFYPNKQITTGEGGMLVTNRQDVALQAQTLRNQGRSPDNQWLDHDLIGYNYRMSELQAAVGVGQMERLYDILQKREKVANRYKQLLQEYDVDVTLPSVLSKCHMSWFVFIVILPKAVERAVIIEKLGDKGIQTKPYFPSIHLQKSYVDRFGYKEGDFPISEAMSKRTLAIPFHTMLMPEEQRYVIEGLKENIDKEA